MWRANLGVAISFGLVATASAQITPAVHQEEFKPLLGCLLRTAKGLDDYQSDAATIAKAMQNSCIDEWTYFLKSQGAANTEIYSDRFDKLKSETAIEAVLLNRRHQKTSLSAPSKH
jgi:hypothetical protein